MPWDRRRATRDVRSPHSVAFRMRRPHSKSVLAERRPGPNKPSEPSDGGGEKHLPRSFWFSEVWFSMSCAVRWWIFGQRDGCKNSDFQVPCIRTLPKLKPFDCSAHIVACDLAHTIGLISKPTGLRFHVPFTTSINISASRSGYLYWVKRHRREDEMTALTAITWIGSAT